jgi:hypothetical protein
MNAKRVIPAFCLAVFLTIAVPGWAQVQFGTFTGEVTDQSGALVPNAEVTITNLGTTFAISVKTGASGLYRLEALPVGRYEIKVEAAGFRTEVKTGLQLNAGTIARVDFVVQIGAREEVVTVEAITPMVNTEDSKLQITVSGGEVSELPLNGRNVYSLIQLAPGAVNATGVSFENGEGTVINGLRPNFIGFTINGVSNKGLSGGRNTLPNPEIVAEFQMLTLNMSAQYGNSAAAITNLVTKSGTNDFHGSVFYFFRNDAMDATDFFLNKEDLPTKLVRFNQFGASATGRIIKDKLFYSASWQSERFRTQGQPVPITVESSQWRQAIIAANPNSVGALFYSSFAPSVPGTTFETLSEYVIGNAGGSGSGFTSFADYLCTANTTPTVAAQFRALLGVLPTDNFAGCASGAPPLQAGLISRDIAFRNNSVAVFDQRTETFGNLRQADEWSSRLDWVRGTKDRVFGEFYWELQKDPNGPANNSSGPRGFTNPQEYFAPNFQFAWVHTVSPTIVNELRVGYARNRFDISVATPGAPSTNFDDGTAGFGSYSGYPQFFTENIYTYSDMMSITKGSHSMKMGLEFRRNLENSTFNVGRPSYYFFDPLFFAVDAPYGMTAGVDPGLTSGAPAHQDENNRAWRNLEMGAFFQDDWKVTRNITLNLGLRYDLYTRHVEKFNRQTTFIPGPGSSIVAQIQNANIPAGDPGCTTPLQIATVVMSGVCGPGGFATTNALGGSDHNNFGPRVGIAWDLFGNGKTALRAGFGLSFEGTLYNPLSNSRWNPPYYSFNLALNSLVGDVNCVVYGPTSSTVIDPATGCPVGTGAAPSFTGPDPNPGSGTGDLGEGNIQGWWPANPNQAFLTGIVFPAGIKDPWITNFHVGVQQEIVKDTVLEVNYVGTRGEDLFRAQQVNRDRGIRLPAGTVTQVQGRTLIGYGRNFLNPNYARLRVWQNVTDSWYDALQVSVRKAFSHGFMVNANYTWSHSLDTGSGWHSGAVTANGSAAGDGYSLDQLATDLDKANSTFDIRQRFIADWLWELPMYRGQVEGAAAKILGGWQFNGSWSMQSGPHWTAYCAPSRGSCDYNFDGEPNDRPDAPNGQTFNATTDTWSNGFFPSSGFGCALVGCAPGTIPFFATPCQGCNGLLGRNTFLGPNQFNVDMSLFKNTPVTESSTLQFRFEVFNVFNHTNFLLPSSATGANFGNRIRNSNFGQSAGTLNARNIQVGVKFIW